MRAIGPRRFAFSVAILLAACQTDPEVGTQSEAILGGSQPQVGQFPTVVGILLGQGQGVCTGTLVADDIVLTAAHCITPSVVGFASQEQVTAATNIYYDTTFLGNGASIGAVETIPHAFSQPTNPDIGIIRLAEPIGGRDPSPINFDPDLTPSGTELDMVGYGVDDSGQAGRLLALQGKVSGSCTGFGVSDDLFMCWTQGDGTGKCSGDSGGPSFLAGTNKVVGITSFGDQQCQVFGADMRTDSDAARTFLADNAPELLCQFDDYCDEACDTDPDCGDTGGEGGLGATCDDDVDCVVGDCANGPGGRRCTVDCDPAAQDCPEGFDCLDAANGGGACWPVDSGGCSAGGSGATGLGLLLIAMVLGAVRRRRRD